VALVLVFTMYHERRARVPADPKGEGRITFGNVLALENFVLLIAVVFGLQFVDRSFGPVLPLYVAELGASMDAIPILSGILFSISAGAGAIGNHLARGLLARATSRAVIAGSAAVASLGTLTYVFAGGTGVLMIGTSVFGLGIGAASTAAYTAAGAVIPPEARGAGFGLLSTGSLIGLATSPIICGLLGTLSLRAVFVLDTCALLFVAALVRRLMAIARTAPTAAPATEEV
jgi:MFS family permease